MSKTSIAKMLKNKRLKAQTFFFLTKCTKTKDLRHIPATFFLITFSFPLCNFHCETSIEKRPKEMSL